MNEMQKVAQTFCLLYRRVSLGSRSTRPGVRLGGNGQQTESLRYSRLKVCATQRAFTMIEIAISLAIIGFALVAIIGILPAGMNVQKENRQETIINQDATVFMNAIRNAEQGLDDLTNYVTAITNYQSTYNTRGQRVTQDTNGYTRLVSTHNGAPTTPQLWLTSGYRIVGLLSTPKIIPVPGRGYYSNHVVAFVQSMSGPASEKYPQNDPTVQQLALSYRLIPEVLGYGIDNLYTNNNYIPPRPSTGGTNALIAYTNYLRFMMTYATNVHDLRLTFRWPLLPNGEAGPGRQMYRTLVTGPLVSDPTNGQFFFFQPHTFKGT